MVGICEESRVDDFFDPTAGDIEYKTVGKAATRFEQTMKKDRRTRSLAKRCLDQMSIVET